jgi:hypothetical protein
MITQSAIIVQEPGRAILSEDVRLPELPDNYILVKTKAGISFSGWGLFPSSVRSN